MPKFTIEELLTTSSVALVLQEIQNGIVGDSATFPALAEAAAEVGVILNARRLTQAARTAGAPVIHATADSLPGAFGTNQNARLFAAARKYGTENAQKSDSALPVVGLAADGDLVLPRYHGLSPMTGTPLDSLLRNAGVSTIVVAGVSLNVAIPNLVFDAINRAVSSGCGDRRSCRHTPGIWGKRSRALPRTAGHTCNDRRCRRGLATPVNRTPSAELHCSGTIGCTLVISVADDPPGSSPVCGVHSLH